VPAESEITRFGGPIAEEELHAYVDGVLEADRRQAVEQYLQAHPDAARRVGAYIAQRQEIRTAFLGCPTERIPPELNLAHLIEARLMSRRTPWYSVAAAVLALMIGSITGWVVSSRPESAIDALARESATSYMVYASDRHHPVEMAATQSSDLTRWLSIRLNRPIAAPDLTLASYRLLGGRLVPSPEGAAALFIYENAHRDRLTLYVRPISTKRSTPIQTTDFGDVDGCAWVERGVGYSLIASENYARLVELSQYVREELRSRS
jgi:anti-sigma factor RsiW